MVNLQELLGPYIKELGLTWPIAYVRKPQNMAFTMIVSESGRHEIQYNDEVLTDTPQFFTEFNPLWSLAHELCHAYLAEQIDPIFSGMKFPQRWLKLPRKEIKKLIIKQQLFMSVDPRVIDLWVNDIYIKFWPNFYMAHRHNFAARMIQMGSAPLGSIALYRAEVNRHGLTCPDLSHLEFRSVHFGDMIWERNKAHRFSQYLQSLPKLSFNRDTDLKLYQTSNQEAARILGFDIHPRLVNENNRLVWEL